MGQFSDPVATHPRTNEIGVPPGPPKPSLFSKIVIFPKFRVFSFKPIPFLVAFFFLGMCILLTYSSENGRVGRSPKPSTAKSRRFSRLLRDLRFVGKLAVLPQD